MELLPKCYEVLAPWINTEVMTEAIACIEKCSECKQQSSTNKYNEIDVTKSQVYA